LSNNPTPAFSTTDPERHPLRLPRGSIRALLTWLILGIVAWDVTRPVPDGDHGKQLDVLWSECLIIALAGYFTSRRFVSLPPDVLAKLEMEGVLARDRSVFHGPLMRLLLVAAFAALGYYLYRHGRLLESKATQVLGLASAFLMGAVTRPILAWLFKGGGKRWGDLWEDAKAISALLAVLACGVIQVADGPAALPEWATSLTVWLVLFYFGSR
jgi:hypothetical protein